MTFHQPRPNQITVVVVMYWHSREYEALFSTDVVPNF